MIDNEARSQFESARFKSLLNNLKLFIAGKENKLLSFKEVSKGLDLHNHHYLGIRTVRVDDIIGSIDRYKDFDHYFLPKRSNLEHRWASIYSAYKNDVILPLVRLYKVGKVYFVLDGNHRVSVAKRMNVKYIDAEVTEFYTKLPITRDMDPKDMFILAEREKFLDITGLGKNRPDIKIRLTVPGKYDFLLNQINNHMYYLNNQKNKNYSGKNYSFQEAALDWYDNIYLPSIDIIDKYKVIDNFPHRTKSDLYVWINAHKYYLREKYGEKIGLSDAVKDFSHKFSEGILPGLKLFFKNIPGNLKKIISGKQIDKP